VGVVEQTDITARVALHEAEMGVSLTTSQTQEAARRAAGCPPMPRRL
jgi:hypothetical protein